MAKDVLYTNGAISVKEKYLLKDKLVKLCEANAEEALRTLSESGFGKGAEVSSVYEYETLVAADERAIDEFIREYAPTNAEAEYLLSPRDFHNAKAIVKARYLKTDAQKMLAPEGLIPVAVIENCVAEENYAPLGKYLGEAVRQAAALLAQSEDGNVSGAQIGAAFERAQYEHLSRVCAKNGLLKKLLAAKADMTNILTALRSPSEDEAKKYYVSGGKIGFERLSALFDYSDPERAAHSLDKYGYGEFLKVCFSAKNEGRPLTEAERISDSYETLYFSDNRYELSGSQPFLYYVFRRRAENADARILFVCLLAGMDGREIKSRLRAF